jgi:hypothetical protein
MSHPPVIIRALSVSVSIQFRFKPLCSCDTKGHTPLSQPFQHLPFKHYSYIHSTFTVPRHTFFLETILELQKKETLDTPSYLVRYSKCNHETTFLQNSFILMRSSRKRPKINMKQECRASLYASSSVHLHVSHLKPLTKSPRNGTGYTEYKRTK